MQTCDGGAWVMKVATGPQERWVGWASAICAVHCLASPVLVLLLPLWSALEPVEHLVLAGLPLGTAWLLWLGIRRHGEWWPAAPVASGVAFWVVALWSPVEGVAHAGLVATGGLFAYLGLQWSGRLSRACGCGACMVAAAASEAGDVPPVSASP
jgi:hypothetical protein